MRRLGRAGENEMLERAFAGKLISDIWDRGTFS